MAQPISEENLRYLHNRLQPRLDDELYECFARQVARAQEKGLSPAKVEMSCDYQGGVCLALACNFDGSPVAWTSFDLPTWWSSSHEARVARIFEYALNFGRLYPGAFTE